jgi:hypothetical protein
LWTVLAAWALANAVILFWPEDDADRQHYESYVAVWRGIEKSRAGGMDDAAWAAFSADKLAELQATIAELEDDAGPTQPAKQQLLWAGRDYLVPILQGKAQVDEAKFFEHMKRARNHIRKQGYEVEELTPPDAQPADSGTASAA